MKRIHSVLLCGLLTTVLTHQASAALILDWQMNTPTPLDDAAGTNDLVLPGGTADPTHLVAGGKFGSGGYSFDGVNDRFSPTVAATNFSALTSDWTAIFWIKTTDTSTTTAYAGSPHVPVLGDQSGAIGFGLGLHGGKAAFRHFNGGWVQSDGAINVANGIGNFVTFVHHGGANTVDIYVNGVADTLALPAGDVGGSPYTFRDIGRTYNGAAGQFAALVLDDVQIYNTALTQVQILDAIAPPVPEPSSLVLLGLGIIGLAVTARRRRASVEAQP